MRQLIVAPLPDETEVDYVREFPGDVAKLVTLASKAGYVVSPQTAAELWARFSQGLCATWLSSSEWDEEGVLRDMLRYAVVVDHPEDIPPPPKGCLSWLDYAVQTAEPPSVEGHDQSSDEGRVAARRAVRDAARAELAVLRRLAAERHR